MCIYKIFNLVFPVWSIRSSALNGDWCLKGMVRLRVIWYISTYDKRLWSTVMIFLGHQGILRLDTFLFAAQSQCHRLYYIRSMHSILTMTLNMLNSKIYIIDFKKVYLQVQAFFFEKKLKKIRKKHVEINSCENIPLIYQARHRITFLPTKTKKSNLFSYSFV